MPTYEYQCKKCGERFDIFQSISEPPRKRCPKCRGSLQRLISGGAGLLFKGSGFYSTDYRSAGYHSAAKKDKETAGGGASASKPAQDASPAPKATSAKAG